MKKVAILLDGSFVRVKLRERLNSHPTAEQVFDFAMACIAEDEELLRIYYYDCPPYAQEETNPISRQTIDFSKEAYFNQQTAFQNKLSRMNHIAYRKGMLSFKGWEIGPKAWKELLQKPRSVDAHDLVPDLEQKRVDIKIGLDIAWLASKNIVDRIILVTGDADFIPAMKFARGEGIQIVLIPLDHSIKPEMREHTDIFRIIKWPQIR